MKLISTALILFGCCYSLSSYGSAKEFMSVDSHLDVTELNNYLASQLFNSDQIEEFDKSCTRDLTANYRFSSQIVNKWVSINSGLVYSFDLQISHRSSGAIIETRSNLIIQENFGSLELANFRIKQLNSDPLILSSSGGCILPNKIDFQFSANNAASFIPTNNVALLAREVGDGHPVPTNRVVAQKAARPAPPKAA